MEKQYLNGKPKTQIAEEHDVHNQSVDYHMDNHLSQKLARSVQKKEERHAQNMLDGIKDLLDRTKGILDEAEDKGQKSLALKAIRETKSIYELLSKIAVKLEEYRKEEQQEHEDYARQKVSEGLEALTDDELKAYIQLQAKVYEADPNYELDREARMFIEGVRNIWPETNEKDEKTNDGAKTNGSETNMVRTAPGQERNTEEKRSEKKDELDDLDLDLDDLNLERDNTIPSEETDPDWLRNERGRL